MCRGRPKRCRRGGGGWRLALAIMLMTTTVPAVAQEDDPDSGDLESPVTLSDEELIAAGVETGHKMDDVPYAMLVESLFGMIVGHGEDFDPWWENRGLDPASEAVRELEVLAADVERRYPGTPDFYSEESTDEAAREARRLAHDNNRYRALGAAFGQWLENRRAEGYPPEVLLDRLLSPISRANFSTESEESLERWASRVAKEFEAGLRSEMNNVPRLLTAAAWEEE